MSKLAAVKLEGLVEVVLLIATVVLVALVAGEILGPVVGPQAGGAGRARGVRTAPIGAVVRIAPFDWSGPGTAPGPGDYLCSKGGSWYLVLEARARARPSRFALVCLKVAAAEVAEGARVVRLWWSPRGRKGSRRGGPQS